MAGLKKPSRKKDNTSPNVILVVFLVLFILSNIILGVWLYYSAQEKEKLSADAKAAKKVSDADRTALIMQRMLTDDSRLAAFGSTALGEDEKKNVVLERKELLTDGGKYKDEKARDIYLKVLTTYQADLGLDPATDLYKTSYKDEMTSLAKKLKKAEADWRTAQKERDEAREEFKTLKEKQDTYWTEAVDKINKGGTAYVAEVVKQAATVKKLQEVVRDREAEFGTLQAQAQKTEKALQRQIKELQEQLADRPKDRPDVAGIGRGEPHALVLDMSPGKPLWDEPVGQIVTVNMAAREATINLGSSRGVKPDLTFTVFAPSKYARKAEGLLRGTLEVVRVTGPDSSVARITSLYDQDGAPISLTDVASGRLIRESENALREGYLLFNMFWGSRVAIAGLVNLSGMPSANPSEQIRQLNDLMYLLERQGIVVDAYVDPADGQVRGELTAHTRYLIRGLDPQPEKQLPGAKEADKEKKDEDAGVERMKAVADAAVGLQKAAVERGLFVISAKNFATAVGYRSPVGVNQPQRAEFRPAIPAAGSLAPRGAAPGPKAAPDEKMPEEKKMPEEGKEKEKAEAK